LYLRSFSKLYSTFERIKEEKEGNSTQETPDQSDYFFNQGSSILTPESRVVRSLFLGSQNNTQIKRLSSRAQCLSVLPCLNF
jgi:hypothetical protein